ncbi:MAG TPA: hypothetical protein VIE43_27510 [Thermoanaerobaculia bacterium]|jgi:hypothetical protein|nr:hypothetical protein [Thermoanaerobaculia bacterium]
MKKAGILFGQEDTFPQALIDRVNSRNAGVAAEAVRIDKLVQGEPSGYDVIIDRISQDVPFYRGYLKNAALNGTAVINNPFWWSADEKFFNNCLATKIGVAVPKTVLLPSKEHPPDTSGKSFRNLAYPLDWDGIFEYIGFPAFFKPFAGGGWKSVYRVTGPDDFFRAYDETGQLVMMLQEEIVFKEYFRCYALDCTDIHIMQYDPREPFHRRYVRDGAPVDPALLKKVHDDVMALNVWLGYDFNTVEMAVRDGIPYAIDFCNPAPDADVNSIGQDNFGWIVDKAADMVIRRATQHVAGGDNLRWGQYVKKAVAPPVSAVGTATGAAAAVGTLVASAVHAVSAVAGAISPKDAPKE